MQSWLRLSGLALVFTLASVSISACEEGGDTSAPPDPVFEAGNTDAPPPPTPTTDPGDGETAGVVTLTEREWIDDQGRKVVEICNADGQCTQTVIARTILPETGPDRGTSSEEVALDVAEPCFVDGMNDFSWPPPEPSTKVTIPSRLLLAGLEPDEQTLGTVGARLEDALLAAGYLEYGYQSIGCSGFALVTRLERIDLDGTPLEGAQRFAPPEAKPNWSIGSYISRLFGAPPGKYRQIVFAATDQVYDEDNLAAAPTREELDTMMAEADVQQLPDVMLDRPFGSSHRLHALIYEFEKGQAERDVVHVRPSQIGGAVHIQSTGIYTELGEAD